MTGVEQRRQDILQVIQERKTVSVADLKKLFGVSGVTVGSDLHHLEQQGSIVKRHGFVKIRKSSVLTLDIEIEAYEEKKKIACQALKLIPDGASLMLYTSSTVLVLARMLTDRANMNIVTNSFPIAHELVSNCEAKVVLIGGYYKMETQSTFGEEAVSQLGRYNCDILFFSCNGASAAGGLTIDEPYEKSINVALLDSTMKKVLLADGGKIGRTRFVPIAPVNKVDCIITDKSAPRDELDKLRQTGVEIIVV